MADIIDRIFTAAPGLHRVDISGLIVMLAGVLLLVLSGFIASKFNDEKRGSAKIILKLLSLAICMAGFAIALY